MSTLRDVADAAGVSPATATRAINSRPGVSKDTMRKVKEAMERLGYLPAAIELRQGPKGPRGLGFRTGKIAYLFIGMDPELVKGITSSGGDLEQRFRECGLKLSCHEMPDASKLPKGVNHHHFDGILFQGMTPTGKALEKMIMMPTVRVMTRYNVDMPFDYVEPDNWGMGEMAADYLKSKGCGRVGLVNPQPGYRAFLVRGEGFVGMARSLGMELLEPLPEDCSYNVGLLPGDPARTQMLKRQAERLAKAHVEGVFVTANFSGVACEIIMDAFRGLGVKEPALVTGDRLPSAPACLDIRIDQISRRAVDQIVWRIRNPHEPPMGVVVRPSLVVNDIK